MHKTPSSEQQAVIDAISTTPADTIIRVTAVAGSGKTTCALFIANAYPSKNILLLTYNRFLSDESAERAKGLDNITFMTFHAFAGRVYGSVVNDDVRLLRHNESSPINVIAEYDVIIFDEFQDMTPSLFGFVSRIMHAVPNAKYIILGDERQCIYQYNGADERYMRFFGDIVSRNIVDMTLSVTYRVPSGIVNFVNKCLVAKDDAAKLIAAKDGDKPVYIWDDDKENTTGHVIDFVDRLICDGYYEPDDIFIIAASAKNKAKEKDRQSKLSLPVIIANKLSERGHLIFFSVDEYAADVDCMKGKIVVSSIHKTKGRERKLVILVGMDSSYLTYYNKDYLHREGVVMDDGSVIAPNEVYVACTRASDMLVIVSNGKLPTFFRDLRGNITPYTSVHNEPYSPIRDDKSNIAVTDLVATLPSTVKRTIMDEVLSVEYGTGPFVFDDDQTCDFKKMRLACKSKQSSRRKSYIEQVADINGIASTLEADRQVNKVPYKRTEVLTRAVDIQSKNRGHIYRRTQITSEDWISLETISALGARINNRIPIGICEDEVSKENWNGPKHYLRGRIDIIYGDDIYEIKTTKDITYDHILQVAVYRWMFEEKEEAIYHETDRSVSFKKGRKKYIGYKQTRNCIVDVNGVLWNVDDVTGITTISRDPPKPMGRTVVYNCLTDEHAIVTILDMKRFGELITQKIITASDEEFICRATEIYKSRDPSPPQDIHAEQ